MITAYQIAIFSAGVFFLNGLLTGVWKYVQIANSEEGKAHYYVDIAHRTSLLYSFAAILVAQFVQISQLGATTELVATLLLVVYFAISILSYMVQGFKQETDNQLRPLTTPVRVFMWTLIAAEIGGFLVLFYGVTIALGSN